MNSAGADQEVVEEEQPAGGDGAEVNTVRGLGMAIGVGTAERGITNTYRNGWFSGDGVRTMAERRGEDREREREREEGLINDGGGRRVQLVESWKESQPA